MHKHDLVIGQFIIYIDKLYYNKSKFSGRSDGAFLLLNMYIYYGKQNSVSGVFRSTRGAKKEGKRRKGEAFSGGAAALFGWLRQAEEQPAGRSAGKYINNRYARERAGRFAAKRVWRLAEQGMVRRVFCR